MIEEKQWHYVKDSKQIGPVPETRIEEMFKQGYIDSETLVWSNTMAQWAPASSIDSFRRFMGIEPPQLKYTAVADRPEQARPAVFQKPTPAVIVSPTAGAHATIGFEDEGVPQVRPWVRFLARRLDFGIFQVIILSSMSLAVIVISRLLGKEIADITIDIPIIGIGIIGLLVLEAFCLSVFGTTPGKWLFNTKVLTNEGKKLKFGQAMNRTVTVWIKGMGLIIGCLITMTLSYKRLGEEGITSWDRNGGFNVIHGRISTGRIISSRLIPFESYFSSAGDESTSSWLTRDPA